MDETAGRVGRHWKQRLCAPDFAWAGVGARMAINFVHRRLQNMAWPLSSTAPLTFEQAYQTATATAVYFAAFASDASAWH